MSESIVKTDGINTIITPVSFSLSSDMTVNDAMKKIKDSKTASYILYITDSLSRLTGSVKLSDLLTSSPDKKLSEIKNEGELIYGKEDEDREEIAEKFKDYDLLSLPIVDEEKKLLGIVRYDDAIDIIREENTEDFEKMAAIGVQDKPYLASSDLSMAKSRIIWLLVLMLSSIITGGIINHYENAFVTIPLLVSFIPMLMDTGGNCGSQSSTIIIRSLAMGEIKFSDFLKVVFKEFKIALIISFVLGSIKGIWIVIQYHNFLLAVIVVCSMVLTIILAKLLGGMLPLLAEKIGIDPATMASPLITTIVDTCSVLIYFQLASAILNI